jgi:polyferredoxin
MTSLAVAKTVVQTAAPALAQLEARELAAASSRQWPWQSVRWTLIDGVTLALLVAALFLRRLRVFRHPAARRVWLLGVVLVIGLWGGNLISLSLIAGWSAEGIPWRLAPGLAAVATVALLVPSLSKANTYCSHICPHGALQQLVRTKRIPINQHPGVKIFSRWCARLPGTLLVLGYLSLLIMPTINLAAWEPFHAYLFRIAGWGAILFAVATIALSAIIPMAYCRLGCPTGRLLDYLRYRASSQKLMLSDLLAVLLLLIALWI